jgi:hypothetical protein
MARGTTLGLVGVNFISGASLTIEKVIIQNFGTQPSAGVRFTNSAGTPTCSSVTAPSSTAARPLPPVASS